VGFAEGVGFDFGGGDAVGDQLVCHGLGAALREALVVGGRAGGVGVAGNLDRGGLGGFAVGGGLRNDRQGTGREIGLVPVEEYQLGFGRRRRRGCRL
jgi:hypothetical protein